MLNWTIFWTVLQPDGYPRPVISIRESNRNVAYDDTQNQPFFGGPTIHVQQGDSLSISVTNALLDTIISIHFHGLHMLHQVAMDGVVGITQNGIMPRSTFVYNFNITQNPGTFFYHSHSGLQSSDGFQGMFIIDAAKQQHPKLLQTKRMLEIFHDYVIPIQDWNHELSNALYVKYTSRNGAFQNFKADYPYPATSILIQGKGQFDCDDKNFYTEADCDIVRKYGWLYFLNDQNASFALPQPSDSFRTNGQCNPSRPPFVGPCSKNQDEAVFMCEFGKTIRMRFVGAGFSLGLRVWIDQHSFLVIAKDGFDVRPIAVEAIFVHAGERIDAFVECNQTAKNYSMFVAVAYEYYGKHAHLKSPNVSSFAQLAYVDANETSEVITSPEDWPKPNIGPVFFYESDYNSEPAQDRFVIFSQSKGHWWNFEENVQGRRLEWWEMNTSTPFTIPNGEHVLKRCLQNDTLDSMFGASPPLVVRLVYNHENPIVYEFFLVNNESQPHPWHVHGHSVDVLRIGTLNDFIENKNLILQNETVLNVMRADTFVVPSKSYVQFRLTANNPGPWIVHCHMPYHSEVGMAFLLSVEYDSKECKYQPFQEQARHGLTELEKKIFEILFAILLGIFLVPLAFMLCAMCIQRCAANKRRKVRPLNDEYVQDVALSETFKPNDQLDAALAAITPPEKSCGCC